MITEETVFILGAGASKPYGYPTGLELRRKIVQGGFAGSLKQILGSNEELFSDAFRDQVDEFVREFKRSSNQSVDLFLARRGSEFSDVGRMAIVYWILHSEINSKFREELSDENYKADWYFYIYNKLTENLKKPEDYAHFGDNKVSFVTFNYDRSLEYFLFDSLTSSFKVGGGHETLIEQFNKIDFYHVYGKVAGLPYIDLKSPISKLEYLSDYKEDRYLTYQHLWEKKDNIRVIGDRTTDEEELLKIKKCIFNAKRVFFLGFGYAEENLEQLDILNNLTHNHLVYGTAFGAEENEIRKIREELTRGWNDRGLHLTTGNPAIEKTDCKTLLRRHL